MASYAIGRIDILVCPLGYGKCRRLPQNAGSGRARLLGDKLLICRKIGVVQCDISGLTVVAERVGVVG